VSAPASVHEPKTLLNLQAAYNGETNAHFRYLSFAKGADEEGFAPVASLFRAAARAEEIHAKNHAEVIRALGAEPKAEVETAVIRSTHENLQEAIKGEVYERDEMYPTFLHQARLEKNQQAARTFHLAQRAETEHAALFTEALKELVRLRGGAIIYYVCPVCGFTSAKADGQRCPVCSCPTDRFEQVR
jgi:rubrerythrin